MGGLRLWWRLFGGAGIPLKDGVWELFYATATYGIRFYRGRGSEEEREEIVSREWGGKGPIFFFNKTISVCNYAFFLCLNYLNMILRRSYIHSELQTLITREHALRVKGPNDTMAKLKEYNKLKSLARCDTQARVNITI